MLQSKLEVIEKKESVYSEASFKNSLKNDAAKKKEKNSKKSDKDDSDDDDDKDLTDEEKDARDYQLQRGMGMVIALAKMQEGVNFVPATPEDEPAVASDDKDKKEEAKSDKKDDKKADTKKDEKKSDKKPEAKTEKKSDTKKK